MAVATSLASRARRITRDEYDRMVEAGLFRGERLELWRGVIVPMSPQKSPHASAVQALTRILVTALTPGGRATVRIQLPLALSAESEPEPDVAVVPWGEYRDAHPSRALLVIEVADTSLDDDRGFKAEEYAAAGVPEYWVVDVRGKTIEVHADVVDGRYTTRVVHASDARCAPRAFADVSVAVREIVG